MRSFLALFLLAPTLLAQTAIGPERQLTAADLHPAAFDQRGAATATDGSGWLVAWTSGFFSETGNVITATRIDPAGNVLDPTPLIIASTGNDVVSHPAIAFGNGRYLVAWGTADSIRVRLVGREGELSPSVEVAQLGAGLHIAPPVVRAAWDGARFLVAWTFVIEGTFANNRRSYGVLDGDGRALAIKTLAEGRIGVDFGLAAGRGEFVLAEPTLDFNGTPNGNGYPSAVRAFRIDDAGNASAPIPVFPATTPIFSPRVAFNGQDYLIVASTNANLPGQSIGARLFADGTVTPTAPFYTGSETVNTLTWIGNEYVVTLADLQRLDALRLDLNGAPSSPQTLMTAPNTTASDAAWNGQRLLVAIDSNGDVYESFLDTPKPVALSPAHQQSPDIASAGGGDAIAVWLESSNAMAIALHNGVPAGSPSILGAAFGSPVVAWSGSEYLAAWMAPSGLVGMRVDRNGAAIDAQPFVIDGLVPYFGRPGVTFDGENFVVAYEIGGGCTHGATLTAAVRRISPGGTLLDSSPISLRGRSCGTTMSLAAGPNGTLIGWNGFSGPQAAIITQGGSTPGAIDLSPMLSGRQLRVVWTGTRFIAADLTQTAVQWLDMSDNGVPGSSGQLVTTLAANATSSSFAMSGGEALFAWTANSVEGLHFSQEGFPAGSPFTISDGDFVATNVAVADGDVLYQRTIDFPALPWLTRIFLREVAPALNAPQRRRASR